MAKHVKPTKEELEAEVQAAIEEAEKLKDNPPAEEEEAVVEPPPETPEKESPVPPEPPEEEEAEPSEEEKEALKKKLSASARENQKIYAKNRVINKALLDADEIPEPTEEELTKEFSQWEDMTETEKTLAKETVISRNWRKKISEAKEQATKIEKWNDSVEIFVDDPKTLVDNPDLEGKTEEFKTFATEEANNSVPFNILVSAFLHQHSSGKKLNKGKMFEHGSGGPNDKPQPKSDTLTLEEGRKLRETDYNKWKEYLTAGKIESDL
ncbi:MAG: hypothetical protein AAB706_02535 [Patescibacteria group bacterium]